MRLAAQPRAVEDDVEEEKAQSCAVVDDGDHHWLEVSKLKVYAEEEESYTAHTVQDNSAEE